ncbi:MAG: hypothetical protein RH946_08475 [Rhodospirillales bacterium]
MVFKRNDNLRGASTEEIRGIDIPKIEYQGLQEVFAYWSRVRGENVAPSLREFRLEELAPAIVPNMTIADFTGPPFDYRFRFFGSMVVQAAGLELTGKKYYADGIRGFGYENAQVFPSVIEERRPIATRTTWVSVQSIRYVSTAIRLPLSADAVNITGCVTVYHFG